MSENEIIHFVNEKSLKSPIKSTDPNVVLVKVIKPNPYDENVWQTKDDSQVWVNNVEAKWQELKN